MSSPMTCITCPECQKTLEKIGEIVSLDSNSCTIRMYKTFILDGELILSCLENKLSAAIVSSFSEEPLFQSNMLMHQGNSTYTHAEFPELPAITVKTCSARLLDFTHGFKVFMPVYKTCNCFYMKYIRNHAWIYELQARCDETSFDLLMRAFVRTIRTISAVSYSDIQVMVYAIYHARGKKYRFAVELAQIYVGEI